MREQAVVQKVGNRSGVGRRSSSSGQKPARRERGNDGLSLLSRARGLFAYLPMILKFVVVLAVLTTLLVAYRAAASASFFQIKQVEVQGPSRASRNDIEATVRHEVGKTGVWNTDLEELSVKLRHLPWVRTAVVTRVLPDGIRVRIAEREPCAVARTAAGRLRWIDDDAVLLGELNPTDSMPPFFVRGLSEEDSDTARRENVERVRNFLEILRDAESSGIAERVSEINVNDLGDVRAQLAGNDSQVEIRLGSDDLAKRLKQGLGVLDRQRQTPRGQSISYIDISQGTRAVIGFTSGAHMAANADNGNTSNPSESAASDNARSRDDRQQTKKQENTKDQKEKSKRDTARTADR